jgi:hypothetical protein
MKKIFLLALMLVLAITLVSAAELCGDGYCNGGENKDNCVTDCGVRNGTRSIGATYHLKEQSISLFRDLCNENSRYCTSEVIGKSIKGKDIWMFKFGNPKGGIVMMDSSGHGPEDCGAEISYVFVKWMMESNDADAVRARNNNYFMIVPVLNVDEYDRQNARSQYTLPNGSILLVKYGVDLNRNAPIGWGGSGSSDPNNNYEYRGLSAASEPETQAIVATLQKYKPAVYVNTHCGMYLRNYAELNNVTQKIIAAQTDIANKKGVSLSQYPANKGCSGGHLCRTGGTYATTGWIIEVAPWADLPVTTQGYIDKFYPKMFAIWLGFLQATEIPGSVPPEPNQHLIGYILLAVAIAGGVLITVFWKKIKKMF